MHHGDNALWWWRVAKRDVQRGLVLIKTLILASRLLPFLVHFRENMQKHMKWKVAFPPGHFWAYFTIGHVRRQDLGHDCLKEGYFR